VHVDTVTGLGFRALTDDEVGDDQFGGRRPGGKFNLGFSCHRITVTSASVSPAEEVQRYLS
jgi:hypothetical protein